jgi:hypothetical protein
MSDITVINDSEQSSLVTNGLAKNGELYLKAAGSTDAGAVVVYDSGVWRTFANEYVSGLSNNYSVDFDGTNDYMGVTPSSSIDLYGFSAWFKSNSLISASSGIKGVLLGQGGSSYFLALGGNATGDFTNELITIRQGAQNSFAYTSASATIDTNWHHIAAAWSTSSATTGGDGYDIYLDGVKVGNAGGTSTPSSPYTLSSAFTIGMRANGIYYFNGLIDEVAIFNSALSASDVTSIYNSGTPNDISSLSPVGWWRMGDNDGGTGTTVTDQGSGGNDGTLTNGPTFSTDVPS